jgi:HKD family nuclease
MAQNLLQEHLYGDLLAPTPGYHTDFALGMTYSLGFDALLTSHLAFGMLVDMDENTIQTPHVLLEAILKNSDKMIIFCNKGSIAVPPTIRKVYSLLEKNIFEVFNPENPKANFHPKLWLIREVHNDNKKDVILKLIVSSRNMAYSDNIDCIVCMTGKVRNAQTRNEKHSVLKQFVEDVVSYSNITEDKAKKVTALAKEVERVEHFEVSAPFEDYDFYPYLFHNDYGLGDVKDYLCGTESIIVSPFIDKTFIKDELINANCKQHRALITRKEYVSPDIFQLFNENGGVFITLDDLASRGMDIHAKMYLIWKGRNQHYLYLGSANATQKAFKENGEFLLRLRFGYGNSKYNFFMKDFYEEGSKDCKFMRLSEPNEKASTIIRWDKAETAMKELMCADDLAAKITRHHDGSYSIVVTSSLKKLLNPVFIAPMQKRDMQMLWKGRASFDGLSADELSEFFILHAETETSDVLIKHETVIRIATEGMPEDRDKAIYKSIIKNERDFVKFLELMLTDSPVQFISSVETEREIGTKRNGSDEQVYTHIYEQMLKTAATNPIQILQIGKVLEKLDKTESVPEEFRKIYKQFANAIK